jgi:hypothetical protein
MAHNSVEAIKPVKNIQVSFRGETYVIRDGCSTVKELAEQFKEVSGKSDLEAFHVMSKSKILDPHESLSDVGIKPGDKLIILPAKEFKVHDVLAMYLFMLSNGDEALQKAKASLPEEQVERIEHLEEMLKGMGYRFSNLNRNDVADGLRKGLDVAYHRLRSLWEHPILRQDLHDPDRIESYRKVVSTNMSPELLKKLHLEDAVESKENWRREFIRITSNVIQIGDAVLDGILDLLLDVLKGKGASMKFATGSQVFSKTSGDTRNQLSSGVLDTNPRMDDPALANDLLFELSESDEENDH